MPGVDIGHAVGSRDNHRRGRYRHRCREGTTGCPIDADQHSFRSGGPSPDAFVSAAQWLRVSRADPAHVAGRLRARGAPPARLRLRRGTDAEPLPRPGRLGRDLGLRHRRREHRLASAQPLPAAPALRNEPRPALPFADGHFDVVWALSVFTHLVDAWAPWLLELHRVLADDGILIATTIGPRHSEQYANEALGRGPHRHERASSLGLLGGRRARRPSLDLVAARPLGPRLRDPRDRRVAVGVAPPAACTWLRRCGRESATSPSPSPTSSAPSPASSASSPPRAQRPTVAGRARSRGTARTTPPRSSWIGAQSLPSRNSGCATKVSGCASKVSGCASKAQRPREQQKLLRAMLGSRAFAVAEQLSRLRRRGRPLFSRQQIRRALGDEDGPLSGRRGYTHSRVATRVPMPPLPLANRVGSLAEAEDPDAFYEQVGAE